jgi:hypothetical protein
MTGCPARFRVPMRVLTFGTAVLVTVGLAVATTSTGAGAKTSSPDRAASGRSRTATVWLCRPGLAHDPCAGDLTLTSVAASGRRSVERAAPTTPSAFDCFYVYPTVSSQTTLNTNLVVQPAERDTAIVEASPFSQLCTVWSPMYRQTTLGDIVKYGIGGLPKRAVLAAYQSLLTGWKDFLAHDDGRPIVFIGHSQGAALLIRLLRTKVDPNKSLRDRTVLAILAGGNLQVPTGRLVGATFHHIPLCDASDESGCAIAYSSFPSEPPAGSPFGRPGVGVSIQSGENSSKGEQVACVNPAALAGGSGSLSPWFVRAQVPQLSPGATTRWVTFPDLYTARCEHEGDATWLQVDHASGTGRPTVTEQSGPTFGYHGDDVNLSLGNLLEDVAAAEGSYRLRHK